MTGKIIEFPDFPIWDVDEQGIKQIDESWTLEQLLTQQSIFYLKDIATPLRIDVKELMLRVNEIQESREKTYETMGLVKIWNHWIVRMKIFAPYYREWLMVRRVPRDTEPKKVLTLNGTFLLKDVCDNLGIDILEVTSLVARRPKLRLKTGVRKDRVIHKWVVTMVLFRRWFKTVDLDGF